MDREEGKVLIDDPRGQEYTWVDFKQDYRVLGHENVLKDFIKDVAAMANTSSGREEHYIIVGVNDDGELVGVSDRYEEGDGPSHILALDDAKIQNVIGEYLSPTPNITLYKFTSQSPKFGVLVINPIKKKPCVVSDSIESDGQTYLQKGLVFVRHGSRNAIALRGDLNEMIEERVLTRREDILEGIRRAADMGPEAVAQIGDVVQDDEDGATIDIGEDADFVLEERISREPVSGLDKQLDQDISQWATHGSVLIESESLWEYYASPDEISIDEEAAAFLTQASLQEKTTGIYWLTYVTSENIRDILESTPDKYHKVVAAARVYAAIGDKEGIERFYAQSSESTHTGDLEDFEEIAGETQSERQRQLISKKTHDIGYKEFSATISPTELDNTELRERITELAEHLIYIENRVNGFGSWHQKKEDFRNALRDLEIVLGTKFFDIESSE